MNYCYYIIPVRHHNYNKFISIPNVMFHHINSIVYNTCAFEDTGSCQYNSVYTSFVLLTVAIIYAHARCCNYRVFISILAVTFDHNCVTPMATI